MKQTIISKCFDKMKRVALTLFAALCVGSVWAEEGDTTTPEVTPEPEPAPSTSALAIDQSAGYVLTGLGELGDQAAVVFTNSEAAVNWTVPRTFKNVEILVVGGGGGGGGHYKHDSDTSLYQGGSGGGGGAVVTGFIKELAEDQVVNVTIGVGGNGGSATTSATANAGAGGNGGNTVLKVGDLTYVTAYGGGGDGGYDSVGVANGGSNSGVRANKTPAALKSVTVIGEGAEDLVSDVVSHVNKGGAGYSTGSGYPGAGGGGAGSAGGASFSSGVGGACGYGYVSMITDERVVYGAGGGGGIGKEVGGDVTAIEEEDRPFIEGAGIGRAGENGTDALANQGAGGGGGSYEKNGGAGGSGIVILRFAYFNGDISVNAVDNVIPKISDKVYTGKALTSSLEDTYAYTVEELGDCTNVGQQTVRVTLNDGYVWSDGDTNEYKDFTWNITQEVNDWKVEPYISHTAWPQVFASTVNFKFTPPQTSFGTLQAELSSNGSEPQSFNGTLPTEPGTYTLRYWVDETNNWAAKNWEVTFTIYRSENFDYGYRVFGLGANKDEVAIVFTKSGSWTVPSDIENAQFLVAGGGGGGGADTNTSGEYQGGAGGGGGGVITGIFKELTAGTSVTLTVGTGGKAGDNGVANSGYGAGSTGGNSVIKIGDVNVVTANGGGRDAGASAKGKYTDGKDGGAGGSGGGGRPNKAGGTADAGSVDATYVLSSQEYANAGGNGCTVANDGYGCGAAGGGGGATEVGGNGTKGDEYKGGDGGEGLASDITGAYLVYGSGGGGSSTWDSAGVGGTGAGDGVYAGKGKDALPNQGGGGGGGSRNKDGGKGGSGIVVFRYTSNPTDAIVFGNELEAEMRAATKNFTVVFNGSEQTLLPAGYFNAEDYVIGGEYSAKSVGEHIFSVAPAEGKFWSDGTSAPKEFTWNILRIDPSYGYIKEVEGDTVVIFTNQAVTATWVPDTTLKNIQFLAVGGGGGGGGAVRYNPTGTDNDFVSPGGGGGGGGVVAGYITELKVDEPVNIKIGRGGTGGSSSSAKKNGNGKVGTVAEDSWFGVGELRYVTACKGGSDKGYNSLQEAGASVAGMRIEVGTETEKTEGGILGEGAPLKDVYISSGGASGEAAGTKTTNGAGGGGGAMGDGADATDTNGGKGGAGYKSSITGTELDYGSGGGGGGGGVSGGAAGDAGAGAGGNSGKTGSSAKANRGGGGGGGGVTKPSSGAYAGGAGGSGIVVFRYSKINAVAKIDDAEYESLEEAVVDAAENDIIQLVDNIETDAAIEITKKVTIDLNGMSVATTQADKSGDGVFWVKTAGDLTIIDSVGTGVINGVGGNNYNMAIWADGGKVVINGGTFTNEGATSDINNDPHFDLIYVKNYGVVEINGGTFKCQTPRWTLNSNNKSPGTFVVKGGKFFGYDPSSVNTDEADVTNWCADGYTVVEGQDADAGYYIVVENPAIAPDGSTEVAADSPEAAAAKVAIKVPAAMEDVVIAEKYAEYFTKTAEYNETTGKYTVTAVLNPVVVKPVIAETTADDTTKEAFVIDADGNVTLNISNKKLGLYYGVQVLAELGADPVAVVPETEAGTLVVPAENLPDGNAAFFKVVVDFAPIVATEAE